MLLKNYIYNTAGLIMSFTQGCIQTKPRKPKSDLETRTQIIHKIDNRVQVDGLEIVKIDTILNFFKHEVLIGFNVGGSIVKSNSSSAIDYFDELNFIEYIDKHSRKVTIEITPSLKTANPKVKRSKPRKTKVKYNYLANETEFEFYAEKRINVPGFGEYQVDIICGEKKETLRLFRRK